MSDAQDYITDLLNQYGLGSLSDWAFGQMTAGASAEQVIQSLRQQPAYQARFPGMAALSAKGHAMSENEYLAYENTATQLFRAAGLPEGFFDQPDDFGNLIANQVSVAELQQRIQHAEAAGQQAADSTGFRDQAQALYGMAPTAGDITAYFLDPDVAQPLLDQKYGAIKAGQASQRTGYGQLTAAEAEAVANRASLEQAAQGFSQLAQSQDLFHAQDAGEQDITRDTQLAGTFEGDANAVAQIDQRKRRRQAAYEGGGGYSQGQSGITGVG